MCFVFALISNSIGQSQPKQKKLNLHFISTDQSAKLSSDSKIALDFFLKEQNLDVSIEQYIHPNKGRFYAWDLNDSLPYFSEQMRYCRDAFFNSTHSKSPSDFYFFLIPNSIKPEGTGFAIPGKNMIFLGSNPDSLFIFNFSKYFLKSIGGSNDQVSDQYALDSLSNFLNQKDSSTVENASYFLFHDDTENTVSNNGWVAYYFWEKAKDGSIIGLDKFQILKPYKRNFGKVNLDVDSYWLKPFYRKNERFVAPVHLALVCLAFFIMLIFRKKVNQKADASIKFKRRLGYYFLRGVLWIMFFGIGYLVFLTTDTFYKYTFFNSTNYAKVGNLSTKEFKFFLEHSPKVVDQRASDIYSEVYIKEDSKWRMKRMKKVLYFKSIVVNGKRKIYFVTSSNKLKTKNIHETAETHLMVFSFYDKKGMIVKEEVYNYGNYNVSEKFLLPNPAKRILVFVNGYRPVSTSNSMETNIMNIGEKGVEYPQTRNVMYDKDRFNYWTPWGKMNQKFMDRISPQEVYYADGHHSVNTSNYKSVIDFAKTSQNYPKPCKGKHICYYYKDENGKRTSTLNKLPFKPNYPGFALRRKHGRIAGKNLVQLLNEVPNSSKNDTLYLVAHSMGYAYALGISDVLKQYTELGAFYILAPENPSVGRIKVGDWKEVYQYGSVVWGPNKQAPCLQDGVAPQKKVKGLPFENRITFPLNRQNKMSFSGSHYIGYYDWIFSIPQNRKGAVQNH